MHNDSPKVAQPGELVLLTEGEYDSYNVTGVATALKAFNPLEARTRYLYTLPVEARYRHFDHMAFVDWLVAEGLIELRDTSTLHLGEYGDAERVMYNGHSEDPNLP